MHHYRVLIVDDEQDICELLSEALTHRGHEVEWCLEAGAALSRVRDRDFDVVIVDIKLGGASGIELCQALTQNRPNARVIMMTAFGDMAAAVAALHAGAVDFIEKPFGLTEVEQSIERALSQPVRRDVFGRLRDDGSAASAPSPLIGESPAMREAWQLICRVADTDTTVLVTGESGTGKEIVARALHERGSRASKPFVAINCAAVPGPLLESELFGHVRGAFTDARDTRVGLFEQADGGTLFLDEMGELPLELQPKLLRVLQERQFRPVGSNDARPLTARIVAATNCDLERNVAERRFREDLFYRLNVVQISLPPLRERGDDILLLAKHFVSRRAEQHGRAAPRISDEVAAWLIEHEWPGNVRQLENAVARAVALTRTSELVVGDFPERGVRQRSSLARLALKRTPTLEELEKAHIERALRAHKGNKTRAAKALGVDRRTLYRKLERISVAPVERKAPPP